MLEVGALVSSRRIVESECVAVTDSKARKCPLDAVGVGVGVGVGVLLLPPQPVANRSTKNNANRLSDFFGNLVWAIFLVWLVDVVQRMEKRLF
jgi:hypothetical protein